MTRQPAARTAGGPISRVIEALHAGAGTRAEIQRQTGLSPDVVDAAIDHLVHAGQIAREQLGGGCPDDGCGGCPSARGDGSAGCGASSPVTARGPITLTLRRRS